MVNDTLSSGSTLVSASANRGRFTASAAGQTGVVTWYLGNLANSGIKSAQLKVTVIVKGPTTITNTATVSLDNANPNPANNTATIATNVDKTGGGGKRSSKVAGRDDRHAPRVSNRGKPAGRLRRPGYARTRSANVVSSFSFCFPACNG